MTSWTSSAYAHFSKYFSFNNSCWHLNFTRLPFSWSNFWQRRLIQDTTLNFVRWNIASVWYFGRRHRRCSCFLLFQTTQIVSPNLICSLPDNGRPHWSDWFSLICEQVGSQTILTARPLTVRKKFLFCLAGLNPNAITPFNLEAANKLCGFWSHWLCCVRGFKRHVSPEATPHCSQWFFIQKHPLEMSYSDILRLCRVPGTYSIFWKLQVFYCCGHHKWNSIQLHFIRLMEEVNLTLLLLYAFFNTPWKWWC